MKLLIAIILFNSMVFAQEGVRDKELLNRYLNTKFKVHRNDVIGFEGEYLTYTSSHGNKDGYWCEYTYYTDYNRIVRDIKAEGTNCFGESD